MTDARLESYLARLRAEFPRYILVALPYRSPDDPAIEHFLHLLDVLEERSMAVMDRALELAEEIYGEAEWPFFLTPVDPLLSREYFPGHFPRANAG